MEGCISVARSYGWPEQLCKSIYWVPVFKHKKALHFSVQGFILKFGADGRTRTGTGLPTTPSRWRVYQFHHIGDVRSLFRNRNV